MLFSTASKKILLQNFAHCYFKQTTSKTGTKDVFKGSVKKIHSPIAMITDHNCASHILYRKKKNMSKLVTNADKLTFHLHPHHPMK